MLRAARSSGSPPRSLSPEPPSPRSATSSVVSRSDASTDCGFFNSALETGSREVSAAENGAMWCVKQSPSIPGQRFFEAGPSPGQCCEARQSARRARMEYEVKVYGEWEKVLGKELAAKCAPRIYSFDSENCAIVMESLASYSVLQESLFSGRPNQFTAASLGEALGRLHASTHSSRIGAEEAERLAGAFANAELRQVQLEHVFSKPSGGLRASLSGKPLGAEAVAELHRRIRALYVGDGSDHCLCHGDLRARSVMENTSGEVKLLDPEFAIYGPLGLDLGSLISGYVLAFVARSVQLAEDTGRLCACISQIWASYCQALSDGGVAADVAARAGKEAAAFACAYVAQDALGDGERSLLKMTDKALEAKAKSHALDLVARCLKAKNGDVQRLVDELCGLEVDVAKEAKPRTSKHCHFRIPFLSK